MLTRLLTDPATPTGTYFDEAGRPMPGSALARDPAFQDRVLAETRAFLAAAAPSDAARLELAAGK
jgi:hypothetical protein